MKSAGGRLLARAAAVFGLVPLIPIGFLHAAPVSETHQHGAGLWQGTPESLLAVYCLLIAGAAMLGGWIPNFIRLTHVRMQMLLSAVGGLILGIAVLHLWPHAVMELGEGGAQRAAGWTMGGMVATFLLLRLFHFHHHGEPAPMSGGDDAGGDHHHGHHHHHHGEACGHPHSQPLSPKVTPSESLPVVSLGDEKPSSREPDRRVISQPQRYAWVGTAIGLAVHTLSDGAALGAAVAAGAGEESLPALGVFLAVVMHKPLDTLTVGMLMAAHGWSATARLIVVMLLAATCPLGAALMWSFATPGEAQSHVLVGCALAVAAGVFLCISLGDLLPEMEFHDHNRWLLTALLLGGIAIAWGLLWLEPVAHLH